METVVVDRKACPICSNEKAKLYPIQYLGKKIYICYECEGDMIRPFSVKIKSKVARAFIRAVKENGSFVNETITMLMLEYVEKGKTNGKQ